MALYSRKNNNTLFYILGLLFLGGCAVYPEPLEEQAIIDTILDDKASIYAHQAPVVGALSLGEVMARALRYNLEYRTERMKSAISLNQFELAKYEMLPSLAAEVGFVSRNNLSASRSVSLFTGNETLEPSTSQDRNRDTARLRFSWNIIDFGVSYFEAKQSADQFLISNHAREKVMSSIMLQAYTAYWQALIAQELLPMVNDTLHNAKNAVSSIDNGLKAGAYRTPVDALKLKKQLIEASHEIESLADILSRSKVVLANLINLHPNQTYKLMAPRQISRLAFDKIPGEILELTALTNSSDVVEQIYNARIDQLETKKAFARLFPGIELSYESIYDSNSFTYNQDWGEASLRVTHNLLQLANTKRTLKNVKLRKAFTKQRRLAVNVAVVAQLKLALKQWSTSKRKQQHAKNLKLIDDKIAAITRNQAKGYKSIVEQVQAQVAALQTNMNFMSTRADYFSSEGTILFTLGLSPLPKNHESLQLRALANSIDRTLTKWHKGELPLINSS